MKKVTITTEVLGYEFKDLSQKVKTMLYLDYLSMIIDNLKVNHEESPQVGMTDQDIIEYLSELDMAECNEFYDYNAFLFDKEGNIINSY